MRRFITLMLLGVLFAGLMAACTDDAPSDVRGCTDGHGETVYSKDGGCIQGSIFDHHGDEGDHGETDDHSEEGAHAEDDSHSDEADHGNEGAHAEPTEEPHE